jgi:hypothetical protein
MRAPIRVYAIFPLILSARTVAAFTRRIIAASRSFSSSGTEPGFSLSPFQFAISSPSVEEKRI